MKPFQQRAIDRQRERKAAGVNQRHPDAKPRPLADGIRVSGCKLRPCTWTWAVIENGVAVATGKAESEAEARAEAEEAKRDREPQP